MSRNNFKFYTPIEIKKSKSPTTGLEVMKIGGIASTADEDSDGEFLDPNGFILDDFLKVGFVNWHHGAKNKPKTIVGEPSVAEIRPDGLYVECELYPSSDMAKEIYETAMILEKDSKTRRLGFSIEGEVIERGSDDENDAAYNVIKKANITGLAITHMPKNAQTFAQIIKGFTGDDISDSSDSSEDSENSDSKGLTTKSGKAIIKESVDKKLKVLAPTLKKSKFNIVNLEEESMYDKIFDTFTDINIEKAEKVFNLLTKISQDMKTGQIDDNKLEKAMNALGLSYDEANPFLSKAKADADDSDDESDDADENVQKEAKKIAEKVQKQEFGDDAKVEKADGEAEEEDEEEKIEKSKTAATLEGSGNKGLYLLFQKEISKAKTQSTVENRSLGVLIKGVLDENATLKQELQEQKEISKAQVAATEEQNELIKGLMETLQSFGATPEPRKSITKGFAEKFPDQIEKSKDGEVTLSITQHKKQILEILDTKAFAKGFNEQLSKATVSFEASGVLPGEIVTLLKNENGINIVQ